MPIKFNNLDLHDYTVLKDLWVYEKDISDDSRFDDPDHRGDISSRLPASLETLTVMISDFWDVEYLFQQVAASITEGDNSELFDGDNRWEEETWLEWLGDLLNGKRHGLLPALRKITILREDHKDGLNDSSGHLERETEREIDDDGYWLPAYHCLELPSSPDWRLAFESAGLQLEIYVNVPPSGFWSDMELARARVLKEKRKAIPEVSEYEGRDDFIDECMIESFRDYRGRALRE